MPTEFRSLMRQLDQLNLLHRMLIHKEAAAHGLYMGQHPILEFVSQHDGCTQREVADTMQVSPASIAMSVRRMEKAGLLARDQDPADLRSNRLHITQKGQMLSDMCRSSFDEVDGRLFAGFTQQELETLKGYLSRMIHNLGGEAYDGEQIFHLIAQQKKLEREQLEQEADSLD